MKTCLPSFLLLVASLAFASHDGAPDRRPRADPPPRPGRPASVDVPADELSKKVLGNGVEDLLDGYAKVFDGLPGPTTGDKLKAFERLVRPQSAEDFRRASELAADFLQSIPGADDDARLRNLQRLLRNIEPVDGTIDDKLKTMEKIMALLGKLGPPPAKPGVPEPADVKKKVELVRTKLKRFYPLMAQVAGKDGYVDRADIKPVLRAVTKPELIDVLVDDQLGKLEDRALERSLRGAYRSFRGALIGNAQSLALGRGAEEIHGLMNKLRVGPSREDAEARSLDAKHIIAALDALQEIPPPRRGDPPPEPDRILGAFSLPDGIPVEPLRPFVEDGKIPIDVYLGIEKDRNGRERVLIRRGK